MSSEIQAPNDNQASEAGQNNEIHLSNYIYIFRKNLISIASIFFVIVLATAVYSFSADPVYKSTAKIVIDEEKRPILAGASEIDSSFLSQQMTFKTHFQLITSRPVMEAVLRRVKLPEKDLDDGSLLSYLGTVKDNVHQFLFGSDQLDIQQTDTEVAEKELNEKIKKLLERVSINEVRNTRLLTVSVEDTNPQMAKNLANAISESYIQYDSELRLASSRKMLQWLSDQLYEVRKKTEDAEAEFLKYKEREGVFSLEGKRKLSTQKIEETNAELVRTKSRILEVEAKVNELKALIKADSKGKTESVPTFLQSTVLQTLYTALLNAEIEYKEASSVFKSKHPEMIAITNKIRELRAKISMELRKALSDAISEKAVLMAREKMMDDIITGYEKEALGTGRKELEYATLEREVTTTRDVYNTLLLKMKETDVLDGALQSNLRLAEPAVLPEKPIKPRKVLNLALAIVLGLLAGLGYAFFKDYMDRTVHNKEEANRFIGVPVLGQIPLVEAIPLSKDNGGKQTRNIPTLDGFPLNSIFTEAYRVLITNLRFSSVAAARKVYLLTSASPREGKTTTTHNLGMIAALQGLKVLIIDADLRVPAMTSQLGLQESKGLSEILLEVFGTPVASGKLGQMGVADLHRLLEVQGRSGVLEYKADGELVKVSFYGGRIIDVDWSTRPAGKRLGSLLLKSDKISREQAKVALDVQQTTGRRLGQVLLDLGFVSPETIAGPLRLHVEEGLQELHRHHNASYTFREDFNFSDPKADRAEAAIIKAIGRIQEDSRPSSDYLLDEVKQHIISLKDKLWLLPSGRMPPNPAELLSSKAIPVLIEMLRDQYDLIVIDSPPVGSVDDAASLSRLADGTILVVSAGQTRIEHIRNARDRLKMLHAPLLGVVINMLVKRHDPYYYTRDYKKSGYYYGESPKSPKGKKWVRLMPTNGAKKDQTAKKAGPPDQGTGQQPQA